MYQYSLTNPLYTWYNALTWGLCYEHFLYACEGPWEERVVHVIIVIFELPPGLGQLVSSAELVAFWFFCSPPAPPQHFVPPLIPGYHTKYSPVLGTRAHELEALRHAMRSHPILKKLETAIYNPYVTSLIPRAKLAEAEAAAKRLFLKYIAKHQNQGITEQNIVKWQNEYFSLSKNLTCSAYHGIYTYTKVGNQNFTFAEPFLYGGLTPVHYAAYHEVMHIEETALIMSDRNRKAPGAELLPTLKGILLVDQIYKEVHGIPIDQVVHYTFKSAEKVITLPNRTILLGELANFYRYLEQRYGKLYQAVISPQSIAYLSGQGTS